MASTAGPHTPGMQKVLDLWSHNRMARSITASSATFYAWDFVLTFQDEVEYFWGSEWTRVKVFFFLNRYCQLLASIITAFFEFDAPGLDRNICIASGPIGISMGLIGTFLVQAILQIRLHALYDHDRRLMIIVSSLFVLQMGSIIAIGTLQAILGVSEIRVVPGPNVPFCHGDTLHYFYAYCIPETIFNGILMLLATYKALQKYRSLADKTWRTGFIMTILIRDSILFFMITTGVCLGSVLLGRPENHDLFTLVLNWCSVIPAATATRVLLNTKKAGQPHYALVPDDGLDDANTYYLHKYMQPRANVDNFLYLDDHEDPRYSNPEWKLAVRRAIGEVSA